MALIVKNLQPEPLNGAQISEWSSIPTAVISDELNRAATMDAGIKSLSQNARFVGRAFTVHAMAADNLAIHHAVSLTPVGTVLVVDAGGYDRNAVWGGILHKAAELRRLAAVVVDGCVRDVAELRASTLPCFARGVVPAGPHKGWGGSIGAPVQAGGCVVQPGDLLVGDDDGVVVIPSGEEDGLLARCRTRVASEGLIVSRLEAGETTVQIFGLEPAAGS